MIQLNPLQNTANTFQAVTGIVLKPEHVDLLLRLHRASNYWTRANKLTAGPSQDAGAGGGRSSGEIKGEGGITLEGASLNIDGGNVNIGTIAQPVTAAQVKSGLHSYVSSDFTPDPYYPWQIVVIDRQKDATKSYAVNYSTRPSMDEFAEHYAKYEDRTHWVHVNDFTSGEKVVVSEVFWKELSSLRNSPKAGPAQGAQAGEESAEEKAFKLTYFTGPDQTTEKFYDREPAAWLIGYHHNQYGKATVTKANASK